MLSSHGRIFVPKLEGIRFDTLNTEADNLSAYNRYGQRQARHDSPSKKIPTLCPQYTLASIHLGVVRTNLMNNAVGSWLAIHLLGKVANRVITPDDQGARNQVWAR